MVSFDRAVKRVHGGLDGGVHPVFYLPYLYKLVSQLCKDLAYDMNLLLMGAKRSRTSSD